MPDPLQLLIDVQDRDLVADQLHHRRAALPERALLADAEMAMARIGEELGALDARLGEVQRAQRRLEDEVASVDGKAQAEHTRLYSGTVSAPRELQAIQEEIDALKRRQRVLEDELLEVMETAEPLEQERARLVADRRAHEERASALAAEIAAGEAVIGAELADVLGARDSLATQVPAELLASYERLRAQLGGVGVARLEGAQCTGCHLTLPAVELDAVRHAGPSTVVHHEECGRILVRS